MGLGRRFSGWWAVLGGVLLLLAAGHAGAGEAPIKLGFFGPLKKPTGVDIEEAAKLAIEEINGAGGVLGRKLEATFLDDEDTPEKGKTAAVRLLFVDKVDFLMGSQRTEVGLAVQPIAAEQKKIFIATGTASPALTDRVLKEPAKYRYYFRTYHNSNDLAVAYVAQMKDLLKATGFSKIAVMAEAATWADPVLETMKKEFPGGIVAVERPAPEAKDLSVELSKIRAAGAQVIFTLFSGRDAGITFARQWTDRKIPALVTGTNVPGGSEFFWQQTEGKANGIMFYNNRTRVALTPKTIPYWDRYVAKYGHIPGTYTNYPTYDGAYILAEAIKKVGSLDPDKLVKALEETDWVGVGGRYKFRDRHEPVSGPGYIPALFIQWQNGKLVPLWPEQYRAGEMLWPAWVPRAR
jgi:branched-chain amino acid transport system substrate-binding protein